MANSALVSHNMTFAAFLLLISGRSVCSGDSVTFSHSHDFGTSQKSCTYVTREEEKLRA